MTDAERRALAIAALTAAVTTAVAGLVNWGLEVVKKRTAPPTPLPPPTKDP